MTRDPQSFAGSIRIITDAIGTKRAAHEAGVSASLVYKWADPDNPTLPNLAQATALDRAYQNATDRPGPIHRAMAFAVGDATPLESDLAREALEAVSAAGTVASVIRDATADDRISPNEYGVIAHAVAEAKRELGDVASAARFHMNKTHPILPLVAA